jgi:hypothetical protein
MSEEKTELDGPDLAQGVAISSVAEGAMLLGHTQGKPVILVRRRHDSPGSRGAARGSRIREDDRPQQSDRYFEQKRLGTLRSTLTDNSRLLCYTSSL